MSQHPGLARPPAALQPAHRTPATPWRPLGLAGLAALWIAGPANWPLWRALAALPELHSARGVTLALGLGLMIAAALTAPIALLAWRQTLKPVIAMLLVAAALGAHFMGSYGIVIDATMMQSVLGTDPREVRDLLGPDLLLALLLLAGLPLVWMWRQPVAWGGSGAARAGRNVLGAVGALVLGAALALPTYPLLSGTMREHKTLRYLVNPLNSLYALGRVAQTALARPAGPPRPIGLDARPLPPRPGQRPPLVLLVIGETARADHFALNGYARDTTPESAALGVLSFRDVSACGTHTAASLPCLLSHQGRAAFEARAQDSENLLDLLQRAGLAVLWIENQAGCKEVCLRVPHVRPEQPAPGATPPGEVLCPRGECLDEALLHGLDERLATLPAARRARGVVLALHTMGSHGPAYSLRSPADRKPFQPECLGSALQDCDRAALLNSYDNSIAYTDHLLARAIAWLRQREAAYDPALLYLSDHGESLGENGLYLHGLPYAIAPREQKQVPMLAWLSPQTTAADRLDMACLRGRLDTPLSHDHLFHTVLGLARVQASEYRSGFDALAPCRGG